MTTQPIITTATFCSLETLDVAEPLYGTASAETSVWFLLEYTDPWAAKAVTDNNLPAHVQQWFDGHLAEIPQSRLLFIKQDKAQTARPTRRFYLALTREKEQRLYAFTVEAYEELLWLDLPRLLAGDAGYDRYLSDQLLYLVCTNGKRDRCCAKFGFALYQTMRALNERAVWQTTHIGGHRYAPTLAVFPQGVYYGQVQPDDAAALMHISAANQIVLPNYRGRTCYPEVVQAADYYLREHTGRLTLDTFTLETIDQKTETVWQLLFCEESGAEIGRHQLTVQMTLSEPLLAGCTAGKRKPRPLYQLLDYTRL